MNELEETYEYVDKLNALTERLIEITANIVCHE